MRITKPPRTEDPRAIQEQQALRGMDTCPSCHSKSIWTKEIKEYTEHHFTWAKKWDCTVCKCMKCECVYESDPYNYRAEPSESILLVAIIVVILFCGFTTLTIGIFVDGWISVLGIGLLVLAICIAYKGKNDCKKHNSFYVDYEPREVIPTVEQTEQVEQTNSSPKSIPSNAHPIIKLNNTKYYITPSGELIVENSPTLPIKKQY